MFSYIHIEKTAGITINRILRRSFGIRHFDVKPKNARNDFFSNTDLQDLTTRFPFAESVAGHKIKPYSDLDSERKIKFYTFLREPLERCASHYQYQIQIMGNQLPFEEWINIEHHRDFQTKKLAGEADLKQALKILNEKVFFVGLVERFDESLLLMKPLFEPKKVDIRYTRKNIAPSDSIKRSILENTRYKKMLATANELDVRLYEHAKNIIFEAQVDSYKGDLTNDLELFRSGIHPRQLCFNSIANLCFRHLIYKPIWLLKNEATNSKNF